MARGEGVTFYEKVSWLLVDLRLLNCGKKLSLKCDLQDSFGFWFGYVLGEGYITVDSSWKSFWFLGEV